jgi:hypothetical protein
MGPSWLAEPTVDALRAALRGIAPDLADGAIAPRGLEPKNDPQWCSASAVVDGRFEVRFAWAEPPALRICYQVRLLDALRTGAPRLPLPTVVAVSRDPAMLVTRRVSAMPFFGVRHLIAPADGPAVAGDLATVLHDPDVLRTVSEAIGPLPEPTAHATTDTLRARFGPLIRPDQRDLVLSWCDWATGRSPRPGKRDLPGPMATDDEMGSSNRPIIAPK